MTQRQMGREKPRDTGAAGGQGDLRLSRRALMEVAAAATAATAGRVALAQQPAAAVAGPNDRIRVAIMGVNGRGAALARGFAADPRAEVVTL